MQWKFPELLLYLFLVFVFYFLWFVDTVFKIVACVFNSLLYLIRIALLGKPPKKVKYLRFWLWYSLWVYDSIMLEGYRERFSPDGHEIVETTIEVKYGYVVRESRIVSAKYFLKK